MNIFPVILEEQDEFIEKPCWSETEKYTAALLTKIFFLMDQITQKTGNKDPWQNTKGNSSDLEDLDKILPGWDVPDNPYGLSECNIFYIKKEPDIVGMCYEIAMTWGF